MTHISFQQKLLSLDRLPAWRASLRASGKKLVVTNGCFDIIHLGHVTYLEMARMLGDALLVGLNSDASVQLLKGPERPINVEGDRAAVLAALASVSGVCVFRGARADDFLALAQPDVYVKGGDYTADSLDKSEKAVLDCVGAQIKIIPLVAGRSTTSVLSKVNKPSLLARVVPRG